MSETKNIMRCVIDAMHSKELERTFALHEAAENGIAALEAERDSLRAYAVSATEALEAYLAAKPQCECTDPACPMQAARIQARAVLAKNPKPSGDGHGSVTTTGAPAPEGAGCVHETGKFAPPANCLNPRECGKFGGCLSTNANFCLQSCTKSPTPRCDLIAECAASEWEKVSRQAALAHELERERHQVDRDPGRVLYERESSLYRNAIAWDDLPEQTKDFWRASWVKRLVACNERPAPAVKCNHPANDVCIYCDTGYAAANRGAL